MAAVLPMHADDRVLIYGTSIHLEQIQVSLPGFCCILDKTLITVGRKNRQVQQGIVPLLILLLLLARSRPAPRARRQDLRAVLRRPSRGSDHDVECHGIALHTRHGRRVAGDGRAQSVQHRPRCEVEPDLEFVEERSVAII